MTTHLHHVKPVRRARPAGLLVALLLALAAGATPGFADVAPPRQPPGSNISPAEGTTQVRMQSEEVVLDISAGNDKAVAEVSCEFIMLNTSDTAEQMQVRFPLADPSGQGSGFGQYPEVRDFQASVDGKVVATGIITTENPLRTETAPIRWATFDATFPPGEEVRIGVRYTTDGTGNLPAQQFTYILETGAGWKDTIGSADLSVRLPYTATSENVLHYSERQTTPGGRFDGNFIRWHWDDLEPARESNLEVTVLAPATWEAVLEARDAAEASPMDPQVWVSLAAAYQAATTSRYPIFDNDPFAALSQEAYARAIGLQPNDAQRHADFAALMWDQLAVQAFPEEGDPWIARILNEISAALALDPENKTAQDVYKEMRASTDQPLPLGTPTLVPDLPVPTPTALPPTQTGAPTAQPTISPSVTAALDQPIATASTSSPAPTAPAASTAAPAAPPEATATMTAVPPRPNEGGNNVLIWAVLAALGGMALGGIATTLLRRRR
ncbi:MAG TPA: hypothetical protein VEY08_11740 [Chloroflexia bacterium]|nr:hypothetical protein [Chloroflexia bacterium]